MRHAEIRKSGKRTDGRGYQIIGDEKKGADDRDHFAAMAHTRVDAAPVRIKAADDHVIKTDERGQNAHRGDQPKRCVTRDGESESDDVGFARAPIAIENGGRALPIDIARSLNVGWYQLIRLKRGAFARRGASLQA